MVFLHPVHNYALVAYDPSALGAVGASMVRAAELLPGGISAFSLESYPSICYKFFYFSDSEGISVFLHC